MSSLTITGIQTDLRWQDKKANLHMLEEKISRIREHTEVVILPEMFATGFTVDPRSLAETMDGPTVEWMRKIAAARKIVLTGSLIIEEGGFFYNRLIWMLPNGELGHYDKRHLFGFSGEDKHFRSGNKRLIASVKGWKINLQVCYDLRFPVWSRQSPVPPSAPKAAETGLEYDLLVYTANWPERRRHAWSSLLTARAIENQCYVVGVNRVGFDGHQIYHSGDSCLVDPLGTVLYSKAAGEEDVFTIQLEKEHLQEARTRFPFWKDADYFTITS